MNRLEISEYYCAPLRLPHIDGGFLTCVGNQIHWHVRIEIVDQGQATQISDVLRVTKHLVDRDGHAYECISYVSVYDLWTSMLTRLCFVQDTFPYTSSLAAVQRGLRLFSDSREHRVVAITLQNGNTHLGLILKEKYLAGELDLYIVSTKRAPKCVVVWRTDVQHEMIGGGTFTPIPIMNVIEWSGMLWRNEWCQTTEDGEARWTRSGVPHPHVFRTLNQTGTPNPDITLVE